MFFKVFSFAILESNNWLFLTFVFFTSLMVGSFLNVVIYRLPLMIAKTNKQAALNILCQPTENILPISLSHPASFCHYCHAPITFLNKIPLLSYLVLKGQSYCCKKKISIQYPLVELFSGVCSTLLAWKLGPTLLLAASLLLTWSLITLSFIDFKTLLLPDQITLPFLWLGLFANAFTLFTSAKEAILGAILGYLFFYLIASLLFKLRKVRSLGEGDLKLIALLGAWFGWQPLPALIFIASLLGSLFGLPYLLYNKKKMSTPLPFGPFLSLGAFIILLARVC